MSPHGGCLNHGCEAIVRSTADMLGFSKANLFLYTSVSVLLARKLIDCSAGDEISIPLEADISQIVPGMYYLTPSLYVVNDFGGHSFFDHINHAVSIQVENVLGFNENMEWNARYWGNVKLPEIVDLRKEVN